MDHLLEMGFTPQQAATALSRTNNPNEAIELLFSENYHEDDDIAHESTPRLPHEPPVVLPQQSGHLYNLILPLLVSCAQMGPFLASMPSTPIDWESEWWRASEPLSDQIIRTTAFLAGDTNRSYVLGAFASAFAHIDELEELVERFYLFCESIAPSGLFASQVAGEDGEPVPVYVIPVDAEHRHKTIMESLASLFWSDESVVALQHVAPVITIVYHAGDQEILEIDETLCLDVFHSRNSNVVARMRKEREMVAKERAQVAQALMGYNSFEGKRIKSVLEQVTRWIEPESSSAHTDLLRLQETMATQRDVLGRKLEGLGKQCADLDLTGANVKRWEKVWKDEKTVNSEPVHETNSEPVQETSSPHHLITVIISETRYFYRSKYGTEEEPWVFFVATGPGRQVTSFEINTVGFGVVAAAVEEATAKGMDVVLVYGEGVFGGELGAALRAFVTRDNTLSLSDSMSEANASLNEQA